MTAPLVRRAAAVFNPASGAGTYKRDFPLIISSLRALGIDIVEMATEHEGHATELARAAVAEGFEAVIAIGGDGTVNEVVNGLAGSEVPLAIIPTGTVNVLALELGIPLDPPDACKALVKGTISWIDLGLAGDRYFALMAGIGVDAAVIASMTPALKRTLREAAFFVQGVATFLTHEDPMLRVVADEAVMEGYFVVIGNSANYGGVFGITPLADMRDGLLDVCVLKDRSFLSTAWYWLTALASSPVQHPGVEYFRTRSVAISAVDENHEVLVQTDGEVVGKLPIVCRIAPRALRVIVP